MFTIRLATEEDAFQVATINIFGWKTAYRGLLADTVLDNLTVTEKRIENFKKSILESEIFLVAEDKSGVLGYLNAGKPYTTGIPYPYEIYGFYVHPDFQRKGVGTGLIKAFKQKIKSQDFCVYLLSGNKKALHFYKKMGGQRFPKFDKEGKAYNCIFREEFLGFNND